MTIPEELLEDLLAFEDDPYGFVLYAFPWREPGTPLGDRAGPEPWQVWLLTSIRDGLVDFDTALQYAIASGHGIGKSATVAWLILWAMLKPETKGVVTANTETQLRTKTWAELTKWYNLCICRDLWHCTATAIFSVDKNLSKTWRVDMVPWSERNTEAFAGLHNLGKRVLLIMDEASAIPKTIWEVARGALTDENTQILWFAFGNPTKNTGEFYDCFKGPQRARWRTKTIDSREVSFTNKKQIADWIEDYGVDSDFVKIRVRGLFPSVGVDEFISAETANAAAQRDLAELGVHPSEPVILGVDVARFGDDTSVIYARRGLDGRSLGYEVFSGINTMELADRVLAACHRHQTRLVGVDGGGVGGGVIDRLRQLGIDVVEVQFGAKALGILPDPRSRYANRRAEIWGAMRDWLRRGAIPNERKLIEELTSPTYTIVGEDVIQLERKDAMRARGAASPDIADALAITFAVDTTFLSEETGAGEVQGLEHNPYKGVREYV